MKLKAAITVYRPREDVERLWQSSQYRPDYLQNADATVSFVEAPGDKGTEIHVDLVENGPAGKLGEIVKKALGTHPRARVMDDLRRFKQHVETGVISRSDGTPEGERAERKLKQRPAQPLEAADLDKAGVR